MWCSTNLCDCFRSSLNDRLGSSYDPTNTEYAFPNLDATRLDILVCVGTW